MSHTSACEHKSRPGRATRQRKARKMQEKTAAPSRGKVVRDARYDRYLNWLREHNFPKAKLVLAEFPDTGRGMMATSDIEAGEIIVSVPKHFLISSEELSKLYGPHPLSAHQLLALHIAILKQDPNSFWKPYLSMLPSHFDTMPVQYPKALAQHLPSSLIEEIAQQRRKIELDYAAAMHFLKKRCAQTGERHSITFQEYEYAWLCVNTRCIHMSNMDSNIKGGNIAMAVFLDFLNHAWDAKIESGYNVRTQQFEIRTLTRYKKGQQVFINYGPHDNLAILREYGFVLPFNEYNFVSLDNEIWGLFNDMESKLGARTKRTILERAGYAGDYTIKKDEVSFRLLNALRLLALDGPDRPGFDRRLLEWQDVVMGETEIISMDNERRALLLLQSVCQQVIETAREKGAILENLASKTETNGLHPFAVHFVRQTWQETADIANMTVVDIQEKLRDLV